MSAAADVATLPVIEQREIVARGERDILEKAKQIRAEKAEARRAERLEQLIGISNNNAPLPQDRKYPVIYADPPWPFEVYNEESGSERVATNHYPAMPLDDLAQRMLREGTARPVPLRETDRADAAALARAFHQMHAAAMAVNEVLRSNDRLNETVPTNWPLPVSLLPRARPWLRTTRRWWLEALNSRGGARGGRRGFLARSSRTHLLEFQPVKGQDKKTDGRGQIGVRALGIDRGHQL